MKSVPLQTIVRRSRSLARRLWRSSVAQMFVLAAANWQRDNCLEMGAALAYYALFAFFPLTLIALSVVGFFLGPNTAAYSTILDVARQSLPPEAYDVVGGTLSHLNRGSTGASIVGFGLLLFAASGFFNALSRAIDRIWRFDNGADADRPVELAMMLVRKRLFGFLLALGSGGLLLLSLMSNLAIRIVLRVLDTFSDRIDWIHIDDAVTIGKLQVLVSFLLLALAAMLLFKLLPSSRVPWGDVWLGGLVSSTLFALLQRLVSSSTIAIGQRFQSYGVVGGVMVLMLWIYLANQIFLIGGELSYAYAHTFGSRRDRRTSKAEAAPFGNGQS